MPEVETGRLMLRRWQDDDGERLVALFADPRVSRFLSHHCRPWPRERSLEVFDHFVRQWEEHGFGPWAAIDKATGRWLGQIGLNELPGWPGPQKIKVGWELDPSVWGRGLATEGGLVGWYAVDRADWLAQSHRSEEWSSVAGPSVGGWWWRFGRWCSTSVACWSCRQTRTWTTGGSGAWV
jgi:hypothetical protein